MMDERREQHKQAIEGLRQIIAEVYPDATRADKPYYTIRSWMATVIRTQEDCAERFNELMAENSRLRKEVIEARKDEEAFRKHSEIHDLLWKDLKVALGGDDSFPVDIDGMIKQTERLRKATEIADLKAALEGK